MKNERRVTPWMKKSLGRNENKWRMTPSRCHYSGKGRRGRRRLPCITVEDQEATCAPWSAVRCVWLLHTHTLLPTHSPTTHFILFFWTRGIVQRYWCFHRHQIWWERILLPTVHGISFAFRQNAQFTGTWCYIAFSFPSKGTVQVVLVLPKASGLMGKWILPTTMVYCYRQKALFTGTGVHI